MPLECAVAFKIHRMKVLIDPPRNPRDLSGHERESLLLVVGALSAPRGRGGLTAMTLPHLPESAPLIVPFPGVCGNLTRQS